MTIDERLERLAEWHESMTREYQRRFAENKRRMKEINESITRLICTV